MPFKNYKITGSFLSEARSLVAPAPRLVDAAACIASVLLAIVFGHWIGAQMVAWAAFTAFVLMRGTFAETMVRGVLRILGTAIGAGLALLLAPIAAASVPLAMLFAGLAGAIALYGTITAKRAYAWLLFGLTFDMILLDKLEDPALDTFDFARARMLEVVAGTVACVLVSLIVSWLTRPNTASAPPAPSARMHWNPAAARHAAQAGVALALLPLLRNFAGIPELAQAGVTIIAVMIVPISSLGASGLVPVSRRVFHRAIGCILGGAMAGTVLILADGWVPLLVAGTCLGMLIGRLVETGNKMPYVGLQFTLAILIVLVPDSYSETRIEPGLERLVSILIGMALIEPVLLAWHLIAPRARQDRDQKPEAQAGTEDSTNRTGE